MKYKYIYKVRSGLGWDNPYEYCSDVPTAIKRIFSGNKQYENLLSVEGLTDLINGLKVREEIRILSEITVEKLTFWKGEEVL